MGREPFGGLMDARIRVAGKMESNMERVCIGRVKRNEWVSGIRANEKSGSELVLDTEGIS